MRVVLSRKGMDSAAGGIPSPIMPDKTLLSLPIPDHSGCEGKYADYIYKGRSYKEIISELNPRFDFSKKSACHLDPDIYSDIIFHAYPKRLRHSVNVMLLLLIWINMKLISEICSCSTVCFGKQVMG